VGELRLRLRGTKNRRSPMGTPARNAEGVRIETVDTRGVSLLACCSGSPR
jgi:hypothetical protein